MMLTSERSEDAVPGTVAGAGGEASAKGPTTGVGEILDSLPEGTSPHPESPIASPLQDATAKMKRTAHFDPRIISQCRTTEQYYQSTSPSKSSVISNHTNKVTRVTPAPPAVEEDASVNAEDEDLHLVQRAAGLREEHVLVGGRGGHGGARGTPAAEGENATPLVSGFQVVHHI